MKKAGLFKKKNKNSIKINLRKYKYDNPGLCHLNNINLKNYREKWEIIQIVEENKRK
jgi:hypothetical protein